MKPRVSKMVAFQVLATWRLPNIHREISIKACFAILWGQSSMNNWCWPTQAEWRRPAEPDSTAGILLISPPASDKNTSGNELYVEIDTNGTCEIDQQYNPGRGAVDAYDPVQNFHKQLRGGRSHE